MMDRIEVVMTLTRPTKNMVRYDATVDGVEVDQMYVHKTAFGDSYPDKIRVTVESV